MNRKTTVTHTDGTISTRTSKTMIYTHAVEVGPADADTMAARAEAAAVAADEKAANLRAAAANPTVTIRDRGLGHASDYMSHIVTLNGTDIYEWANSHGDVRIGDSVEILSARAALVAHALFNADSHAKQADLYRDEAADIRASGIKGDGWSVYRWSTRADLAAKAAQEAVKAFAGQGRTIRVVAVD